MGKDKVKVATITCDPASVLGKRKLAKYLSQGYEIVGQTKPMWHSRNIQYTLQKKPDAPAVASE